MSRPETWDSALDEAARAPYLAILEERFGIAAATFADLTIYRANNQALWSVRRDLELPESPRPFTLGMPFFYHRMRFPRPTTATVLRWGHLATRNLVELEEKQMRALINYGEIEVGPEQLLDWCRGYTILRFRRRVLGIALGQVDDAGRPRLRSLTPKFWRLRYNAQAVEEPPEA